MDFRWKNRGGGLPQVQPNFVDPQGVRATMAQQQMAGYQPNPQPNMQGYSGAPTRAPMVGNPGSGEGYQFDASGIDAFNEKKQKLERLKAQLSEVDAEIAKVQRQDVEQDVAAKLASIGELGLYQQLISQRQNANAAQRSATQGIENELYNAEKLVGILESGSDEERANALASIEAAMRKAKEQGDKSGFNVEGLPSYKRLLGATEKASKAAGARASDREWANELWYKARKGDLVDADIAKMEEYIASNPNSDVASQLRPLVEQYKPKTRESRATRKERESDAKDLYSVLSDLPRDEQTRRIRNLSAAEYKLLEDFYPSFLK